MKPLPVLLILFSLATVGHAAYYAESWGDWHGIAARQGVIVPASHTCVAVPDCNRLGEHGLLWIEGAGPREVVVCDCTAQEDQELVQSRNVVVEVPWGALTAAQRARGLVEARIIIFKEQKNGQRIPDAGRFAGPGPWIATAR